MTEKPKAYLITPYSHEQAVIREMRYKAACEAAGELIKRGRIVFSPIAHSHGIAVYSMLDNSWEAWSEQDIAFLTWCDEVHVLMLQGWRESKGCADELKLAEDLGKPIKCWMPAELGLRGYDGPGAGQ